MDNRGALSDIRVIEMGQLLAGPFCGQLLGDMGAEVIKLEPPGAGDPMRLWGQGADKVQWEVIARNKKSVSLNLRMRAATGLPDDVHRQLTVLPLSPGHAPQLRPDYDLHYSHHPGADGRALSVTAAARGFGRAASPLET